MTMTGDGHGVIHVTAVVRGGQADLQAVEVGDVIVGLNGVSMEELLHDPRCVVSFADLVRAQPRPIDFEMLAGDAGDVGQAGEAEDTDTCAQKGADKGAASVAAPGAAPGAGMGAGMGAVTTVVASTEPVYSEPVYSGLSYAPSVQVGNSVATPAAASAANAANAANAEAEADGATGDTGNPDDLASKIDDLQAKLRELNRLKASASAGRDVSDEDSFDRGSQATQDEGGEDDGVHAQLGFFARLRGCSCTRSGEADVLGSSSQHEKHYY
jgi:hypothetical protein